METAAFNLPNNNYEKARDGLDEVLALQRNHLGAIEHVRYLEEMDV